MFLVDTNVISEARKGVRADPGVRRFWRESKPIDRFVAVQTLGEIRHGVERIRRRGDEAQASVLGIWLERVLSEYANRILVFDAECALVWGKLMSLSPQHSVDRQIAAIALIHDLTLVTRNTDDFRGCGTRLLNPFSG